MFSFKKVEVKEILKVAPDEPYQKVLVIGEIEEVSEDENIEEFYFLIEDVTIKVGEEEKLFSGYMKAYFPANIIEDMYLYIAATNIEGHELYFIEPNVYETIEEDTLKDLLLEVIDYEEQIDELDMLEVLYLNQNEFYELTGVSAEVFGKQYVTNDLMFEFVDSKEEFHEHMEYEYHKEPLLYRVNDTEVIFVGIDSLKFLEVSLLEINEDGDLIEKANFHTNDALEYFEDVNYSVRELMSVFNIVKDIEKIAETII